MIWALVVLCVAVGFGLPAAGYAIGALSSQVTTLSERLDAKPSAPAPRPPLEQQDRQSMQASWPIVCCASCGRAHTGECPRVRRSVVKYHQNGTPMETDVWYWPNDAWEPPSDALTADQVWGTSVPLPPVAEEEGKK